LQFNGREPFRVQKKLDRLVRGYLDVRDGREIVELVGSRGMESDPKLKKR
jgi:hypothetical protein